MAEVLESIKSQRGNSFFFLMSDEYRGSKDNPLPMYELVLHAKLILHVLTWCMSSQGFPPEESRKEK